MNLEREAFLRKLEGGQEPPTRLDETHRFLANVGLDSTPIDPASLKFLEEMLISRMANETGEGSQKPNSAPEALQREEYEDAQPVVEVTTRRRFQHSTSEVTMHESAMDAATDSTASVCQKSSRDDLILHQLKIQTAIMMELQARIEDLTEKVNSLTLGSSPGGRVQVTQQQQQQQQQQPLHPPVPNFGQHWQANVVMRQHREVVVPNGPPPPPPRPPTSLFGALCEFCVNFATTLQNYRTAELIRVFVRLHRRHVRVDGAFIFKIVLMVGILSAKLMSRPEKPDEFWTTAMKLNLVMTMVVIGFMIQSGYITFLYRFFIEHRLMQRIYGGEEIDYDRLVWNNPAPPGNHNGNLRNIIPRNHLLGGNIPAPRNGMNVFVDIAVLLGSFVLSILPIWKPEGQPQERQARMAQAQAHQRGNLNAVAPPPDLDQHAADDDDEDDDNNNDAPHAHQD